MSEEIKDAIRRRTVDREEAKTCSRSSASRWGKSLHAKLKSAYDSWKKSNDDAQLVAEMSRLSRQFGKECRAPATNGV